jgi:hypothetical protein
MKTDPTKRRPVKLTLAALTLHEDMPVGGTGRFTHCIVCGREMFLGGRGSFLRFKWTRGRAEFMAVCNDCAKKSPEELAQAAEELVALWNRRETQ